ncbi:MAG: peptidylprolyl isomerase [Proteobacteria bacterium]|nr:peptidylprolyl isomerase [Pseudomonadota bacterium]
MRLIYKGDFTPRRQGTASRISAIGLSVALVSLLFIAACGEQEAISKPKSKPVDKVIATVDERPIMRSTLDRALNVLLYQGDVDPQEREELDDEELKALKKSVLNELIEEELVIEQARKEEIKVTPEELDKIVTSIMGNTEQESFNKAIVPLYGTFENWKGDIKRKLLVARVIDGVKGSVKKVSDWEVSKYYIRNEEEYRVSEQVKAAMILVATKEEADKVKARLAAGEDFASLARELSTSPEAQSGGELGRFSRGEMPREFEEIVFKIPPRVPSDVLKTSYGYHIFLVRERQKGRKLKFEKVKLDIKAKLMAEKVEERLMEWILSLKKEASIEILEEI